MGSVALSVDMVRRRSGRAKADGRHVGLIIDERLHPQRIDGRVIDWFARVLLIHDRGERQLLEVAEALDLLGLLFGFTQGRQEHAGKDCDDGNNDQQFDQGKARPGSGTVHAELLCKASEPFGKAVSASV